jgi:hypothetical protein
MPLTRRLILQKARRHPHPRKGIRLRRIVGKRFQVLFHSPPGVLFTFPSRYSCTIGHQGVFSLARWSWRIHGGLQGSAATREHTQQVNDFRLPDYHRLWRLFPEALASRTLCNCLIHCQLDPRGPTTPRTQPLTGIQRARFRLGPLSLATTHGITCCFLFLPVLRCFTSRRSLHTPYVFRCR